MDIQKHKDVYKKLFLSPFLVLAVIAFVFAVVFSMPSKKTATVATKKSASAKSISSSPIENKQVVIKTEPSATIIPSSTPTTIPTEQQQSTTPATVTLVIHEPNGTITDALVFHDGLNPCSLVSSAKDQGKIASVTIKTYGPPLNSDYVQEINGYQNNWTFSLNGNTEPKGCSNYTLSNKDTVTWQYN
ncbi:MAG: DUF4430 domain-containing protein [Candidatus Levyibacteriota bacterium]